MRTVESVPPYQRRVLRKERVWIVYLPWPEPGFFVILTMYPLCISIGLSVLPAKRKGAFFDLAKEPSGDGTRNTGYSLGP